MNYQCPNCNGPLTFNPKSQKLKCDNCGSTFTIEEIDAYLDETSQEALSIDDEAVQAENAEILQWSDEEKEKLRAYSCPSCGAQLITDATTAASRCPYCGNPQVIPSQFTGDYKPDALIPFKINEEQAKEALHQFYHGKHFLPKAFVEENHISEIKGVYVPFWLYDAASDVRIRAQGTRSTSRRTNKEIITTTYHYRIERDGSVGFTMVPADGSKKMPDDLMDSIEPFSYADLVPFQMSYLPGYLADKYDITAEEDADRVNTRMKNSAVNVIKDTIGMYETLYFERQDARIRPGRVQYVFMPVWLLSTQYNNKNYLFAVNGQTGKMAGDTLPSDPVRMIITWVALTIFFMAVIFGLFHIM